MPDRPYVVFLHATSRADKLWPEASWRALIAAFAARGFRGPPALGHGAERARSERLAAGTTLAAVPAAADRCRRSPALLARAELVVGVDTGLVHLAAALGTPTVSLFVATDARLAGVERASPQRPRPRRRRARADRRRRRARRRRADAPSRGLLRTPDARALHIALVPGAAVPAAAPVVARTPRTRLPRAHRRALRSVPRHAPGGPVLWVHAVSLGETRAAAPLVDRAAPRVSRRRPCSSRT